MTVMSTIDSTEQVMAPVVPPPQHVIPKPGFAWVAVGATLAAAVAAGWIRLGPLWAGTQLDLSTQEVHLAGKSVAVGFAFTLCLSAGLLGGTTVARWVFWTPRAAAVASVGWGLACVVLVAGLTEGALLWPVSGGSGPGWVMAAATLATVKWSAVVASSSIAVTGALVAIGRLSRYARCKKSGATAVWRTIDDALWMPAPREETKRPQAAAKERPTRSDEDHDTPEDAPRAASAGGSSGSPGGDGEARWRLAYDVPDITTTSLDRVRNGEDVVGFALSGGGIRSGSLGMGVLETLRTELRSAQYLVSISGGGYTAGAFAQLLTDAPVRLPRNTDPIRDPETAYTAGTVELDHLRRHSAYLASTAPQMAVALGVLARGMLATLALVYGPAVLLGALAAGFYYLVPLVSLPTLPPDGQQGVALAIPSSAWWSLGVVATAGGLLWLSQLFGRPGTKKWDALRRAAVFSTRMGLVVAAVTLGIPAVIAASWWVSGLVGHSPAVGAGASMGSLLLTYLASLAAMAWRQRTTISTAVASASSPAKKMKAAVPAGVLQLLLVILSVTLVVVSWLLLFGVTATAAATSLTRGVELLPVPTALCIVAVAGLVFLALSDEISLSLHPFYRRRLASAFATRSADIELDGRVRPVAIPYDPTERTRLSRYARAASSAGPFPTFIFAAAANLTGQNRTPPGMTATSFTMSADWVGGPDVGWVKTSTLEYLSPLRLKCDLTVQGAVAISGAAFATAMGRFSRWYQVILALTGARLGSWLPNPVFIDAMRRARDANGRVDDWTVPGLPKTRRATYLLRELFNIHPVEERLLQVTDGGHYENLGIVELLRRRCTTIYCVDGGGDSPPTAQGLAQAIALAESELGVKIDLHDPLGAEPGSGKLRSATPSMATLESVLVKRPVITGTITYPAASGLDPAHRKGTLVVGRALLWPKLPYWLLSYAVQSPVFPHDSTGDQFFSDDQFTAYLQLGRELGHEMRSARRKVAGPLATTSVDHPAPVTSTPEPPVRRRRILVPGHRLLALVAEHLG